jgi:hypothetical protein
MSPSKKGGHSLGKATSWCVFGYLSIAVGLGVLLSEALHYRPFYQDACEWSPPEIQFCEYASGYGTLLPGRMILQGSRFSAEVPPVVQVRASRSNSWSDVALRCREMARGDSLACRFVTDGSDAPLPSGHPLWLSANGVWFRGADDSRWPNHVTVQHSSSGTAYYYVSAPIRAGLGAFAAWFGVMLLFWARRSANQRNE